MSFCLSRQLPHCCEGKPLPGEQEGSSRAMEFLGQAGGVYTHFLGIWWWGLPVTVRQIDSPFAIAADSINDMIKVSICVSDFFVVVVCLFVSFSPSYGFTKEINQWEVGMPA